MPGKSLLTETDHGAKFLTEKGLVAGLLTKTQVVACHKVRLR